MLYAPFKSFMAMILIAATAGSASACVAPERPFLPERREDIRAYADLIRADFEAYIADVQEYFRCIDAERAWVFDEAQAVAEDYGQFLDAVE